MALIYCPECNNQVSEQAISCPHCGFNLKRYKASENRRLKKQSSLEIKESVRNICRENRVLIIIFGILVVVLILFCVIFYPSRAEKQQLWDLSNKIAVYSNSSKDFKLSNSGKDACNEILLAYNSLNQKQLRFFEEDEVVLSLEPYRNKLLVENTIESINNIGKVSLYSQAEIGNARFLYEELAFDLESQVNNYVKLLEAEQAYCILTVEKAIKSISLLGEPLDITIEDQDLIENASIAYNQVPSTGRELVTNYSNLVIAKKRCDKMISHCALLELYTKLELKDKLKDPSSLEILDISSEVSVSEDKSYFQVHIVIDYTATNGFGARVRDIYSTNHSCAFE